MKNTESSIRLLEEQFQALRHAALANGLPFSEEILDGERLVTFVELLERWTERVDLIAKASREVILENHILDSLAAVALSDPQRTETGFLDIGTGGGIPGMIYAIQRPERPTLLNEPREKRCLFLKEARRVLELSQVQVLHSKVEDIRSAQGISLATTRAVGMEAFLFKEVTRLGIPKLLFMVGPSWSAKEALPADAVGCSSPGLTELNYTLPSSGAKHRLAIASTGI